MNKPKLLSAEVKNSFLQKRSMNLAFLKEFCNNWQNNLQNNLAFFTAALSSFVV